MQANGVRAIEYTQQHGFAYRFDWGLAGLRSLAPVADAIIVVDIFRFTSAVSAALEGGSTVLPFPWARDDVATYASDRGATVAGFREDGGPSLSPTDLLAMSTGARLVLPSPNGAMLSFSARELGASRVFAGSLRNATATARWVKTAVGEDGVIGIIGAGERWAEPTGPVRPALEDLIGAGAILAALDPSGAVGGRRCSPEAAAARVAFLGARSTLFDSLSECASGRELIDRGWDDDVATSAAYDVTTIVAELVGDEFVAVERHLMR